MVKTILVTVSEDVPDAELDKIAKVVVTQADATEVVYNGKVSAIITHPEVSQVPPSSSVTISAPGLTAQ